ncbi:MAG: ABC transporter ATP-binding protein [Dermatophilaceae bacterium]
MTAPTPAAEVLVRADGVGKRFARVHRRATSLKERLVRREHGVKEDFWALRDVDLVVHRGETVGLTGPNGSGKSTLLKLLSGILRPSAGHVQTHGRVASLLELGAGFDGELTGRENIYLNSALLGVPRSETDRLFDDIVAFSELAEFIDNPVKHYSSGMYVRLGFAVAVHIDPDILIVDEVLAVGDAAFQKKCLDRIREFQQEGKTILFVSHSPGQVTSLCTRAVLLSRGRVLYDGEPQEAVKRLHELLGVDEVKPRRDGVAQITAHLLVDPSTGQTPAVWQAGAEALFMADIEWLTDVALTNDVHCELSFQHDGEPVAVVQPERMWLPSHVPVTSGGRSQLRWQIAALPPLVGGVTLRLEVLADDTQLAVADMDQVTVRDSGVTTVDGSAWLLDTPASEPADPVASSTADPRP